MIDLNHGSQVVYGASQEEPITGRINTLEASARGISARRRA